MPKLKKRQIHTGLLGRKSILVPVDFSGASGDALKYAFSGDGAAPSRITLLHVISPQTDGSDHRGSAAVETKLRALISEQCGETDHGVHTLVRTGTPFQEILAATKQLGADMIILAVSESGPISIGHTAERVLRYASCPVLLLRPGDAAASRSKQEAIR